MYVTIDLRYIDIWKLITLSIQVAELMAAMAKNPELSYCKIVEVIAETTAPLTPAEKLLAKIPSQRPYIPSPKVSTSVYNTFCDVYFELLLPSSLTFLLIDVRFSLEGTGTRYCSCQ
jgi:hypothetical protein